MFRLYVLSDDLVTYDDLSAYMPMPVTVTERAEEASPAQSTVTLKDPDGTCTVVGLRPAYIEEDTAPVGYKRVWTGYTWARRYHRGHYRTGASRYIELDLIDLNAYLGRRVLNKTVGGVRPAETDIARLTWLLSTYQIVDVEVTDFVDTSSPTNMSDADYRGQFASDVLNDLMQQSQKNAFLYWDETAEAFGLWYAKDDWDEYTSDLSLSNDLADIDTEYEQVWPLGIEDDLTRSPERQFSGVRAEGDGIVWWLERQSTIAAIGGRRDTVMTAPNVKRSNILKNRANGYLTRLANEEDVLRASVELPRAMVNYIKCGQRLLHKATHLPDCEEFRYRRVISRTVTELSEQVVKLDMELTSDDISIPGAGASAFAILHRSAGPFETLVWWDSSGDAPDPGFPAQPTTGLIEILEPGSPPTTDRPYRGFTITGTGTIDVEFYASVVGVLIDNIVFGITWAIRKNGTVVASQAQNVSGFLQYLWVEQLVSITGLAVEPGDVIDATIACIPPTLPFFKTPGGAGQAGERLVITGGTLV